MGVIATASRDQAAVNAANTMVQTSLALRAVVAPLLVPIGGVGRVFDQRGNIVETRWAERLDQVGWLVVELGQRYQPDSQPAPI